MRTICESAEHSSPRAGGRRDRVGEPQIVSVKANRLCQFVREVLADTVHCLLTFREKAGKKLENMDHFWPYFQLDLNSCGSCSLSQAIGIIQQGLGVPYLNQ